MTFRLATSRLLFFFAVICLACLAGQSAGAISDPLLPPDPVDEDEPWDLQADRINLDREADLIQAYGDVLLQQPGITIQADYARYERDAAIIHLEGNVRIRTDDDSARGTSARLHLDEDTGQIREGRIFLSRPHLHIWADELNKTGPDSYAFREATVTSCDGENPDWSIKTSEGSVTIEGYARLWHPRLQIRDVPVLYAPYMILPAKRERQSGFLMPEFSSSTRDGFGFTLPYYQVIGPTRDATFYLGTLSRRGARPGLEYRLTPNPQTKGLFRADWLRDQKGPQEMQDYYEDYERPDDHRFWLRGKYNGFLGSPQWKSRLDLDFASDPYYLREFDYGFQGFDRSREIFLEEFGRDIPDKDDPARKNVGMLTRNWRDMQLRTRVEYNQHLEYFRDNPEDDPTLQRLPQLGLDFYRRSLGDTPFQWEADNQATHFWRREGHTGTRLDMHPRLGLPLQSPYGTLHPSLGWRETLYHTGNIEEDSELEEWDRRGIWDFSTTASTEFFRIFTLDPLQEDRIEPEDIGRSQWSMLRHTISPRVQYDYIPEKDQEHLPNYDSVDRIGERNEITYTLSSLLTLREDVIRAGQQEAAKPELGQRYTDLLRLDLEQSYDFNEADREEDLDEYPRRPFSDIRMQAELNPFDWISLSNTSWYSPYIDAFTEHEHRLDLSYGDLLSGYYAHDYLREMEGDIHRIGQEELSIARAGATLDLENGWSLQYDMERDMKRNQSIEQRARVGYEHQCWKVGVQYSKKPQETRVAVTVGLLPFGELDQDLIIQEQE